MHGGGLTVLFQIHLFTTSFSITAVYLMLNISDTYRKCRLLEGKKNARIVLTQINILKNSPIKFLLLSKCFLLLLFIHCAFTVFDSNIYMRWMTGNAKELLLFIANIVKESFQSRARPPLTLRNGSVSPCAQLSRLRLTVNHI